MIAALLLALPMAVFWVLVLGDASLESFGIGLVIGFALALLLHANRIKISSRWLPGQFAALVIYVVTLMRDVIISSIEVARIVLSRDLPINPDLIEVPTQDETKSDFLAAFSAHGITLTPGQLVVDFDEPEEIMYVHCLNKEASSKSVHAAQSRRLRLLQRIEGSR